MQRRVGDITIESIASETAKFAAPLVLVPGLWCSAAVWRKFMGYLAHRGWTCHAVNLYAQREGGGDQRSSPHITDCVDSLQRVIALCDAAPVVIGHDLGGLLALACPPAVTRAVVAFAPVVPRAIGGATSPLLSHWRARVALWRSRPLPPPPVGLRAAYFAQAPPGAISDDWTVAARDLDEPRVVLPLSGERATLLIAGGRDVFCPPPTVERLARRVGAYFQIAEQAGHAMPWEDGWEQLVATTHRWIVRVLGEPLLLLRDDEE